MHSHEKGKSMKKLAIENPFFDVMEEIGDLILLNIVFIITCIPIITIGMAWTALYKVILRKIKKESNYVVKEYLKACREEWRQSTKIWLIFLISGCILAFDVLFAVNIWKSLSFAIGCFVLIWYFAFSYVFPLQAQFENTVKNTVKNALYLSIKYFPYTILFVILNIIPVVCIILGTMISSLAAPVYIVVGFALTARINGIYFHKIFSKFMKIGEEDVRLS